MTLLQLIILALIQGLTEFLPISSAAHLILPSQLLGWPDQGLAFDVAVHIGTLLAVVWYFHRDIFTISSAWLRSLKSGRGTVESKLGWWIIIGTIPAGLAGLLLGHLVESHLRSMLVIAATTIIFGALLGLVDRTSVPRKNLTDMGWKGAVAVGVAQAVALIPGTSRSGITITMALALGFDRVSAARFSFLLSIPIILLSGLYKGVELLTVNSVQWGEIMLGVVISALTAYLCIRVFLTVINRMGMMPFVWYRLILGGVLLAVIFLNDPSSILMHAGDR